MDSVLTGFFIYKVSEEEIIFSQKTPISKKFTDNILKSFDFAFRYYTFIFNSLLYFHLDRALVEETT